MTITYYPDLVQGSDEWLAARAGIVTASVVGRLLSVSTLGAMDYHCPECAALHGDPCVSVAKGGGGKPIKIVHSARTQFAASKRDTSPLIVTPATGDEVETLALTLAAERITGHVDQQRITDDMWRGKLEEPMARDLYAEHHAPVDEVGFIVLETSAGTKLGYSPDGLVGEDGAIEVKSRLNRRQLKYILTGKVPAEHMPQLQCGLFVTGRKWIDYVACSGGMPLIVKRVLPQPDWFEAIALAVHRLENTIAEMVAKYEAATEGLPVMERIQEIPEMVV